MSEVHDGCPFCVVNRKVQIIAWSTSRQHYLVKAHGHDNDYLVVPVAHVTDIVSLDDNLLADAKELLEAIPWYEHGVAHNHSLNIGEQAGQRVKHLHWWVIYRGADPSDGLGLATLLEQARRQ